MTRLWTCVCLSLVVSCVGMSDGDDPDVELAAPFAMLFEHREVSAEEAMRLGLPGPDQEELGLVESAAVADQGGDCAEAEPARATATAGESIVPQASVYPICEGRCNQCTPGAPLLGPDVVALAYVCIQTPRNPGDCRPRLLNGPYCFGTQRYNNPLMTGTMTITNMASRQETFKIEGGQLYHRWVQPNNTWSAWFSFGGLGLVALHAWGPGPATVVVTALNRHVYQIRQDRDDGHWTGWLDLTDLGL